MSGCIRTGWILLHLPSTFWKKGIEHLKCVHSLVFQASCWQGRRRRGGGWRAGRRCSLFGLRHAANPTAPLDGYERASMVRCAFCSCQFGARCSQFRASKSCCFRRHLQCRNRAGANCRRQHPWWYFGDIGVGFGNDCYMLACQFGENGGIKVLKSYSK